MSHGTSMDSQELDCLFSKDPLVYKHYSKQIYYLDTIPDQLLPNKFYLINLLKSTDSQDKIGHWVVILGRKSKHSKTDEKTNEKTPDMPFHDYIFCDPLGHAPPRELYNKINHQVKFYLKFPLQNILTTTCGIHSLILATFYSYGFSIATTLYIVYNVDNPLVKKTNYYYDIRAKQVMAVMFHEHRSIFYDFD